MSITIKQVDVAEYLPRCMDLFAKNWAETGFDFELDPDVDRYISLQKAGYLIAVAALDGDDVIGYCTLVITPHPFNSSIVCATHDVLYVLPEYRGFTSARLIRFTEQLAKERGAVRMFWHTRAGTPLAGILQKRGYSPADIVVGKEI